MDDSSAFASSVSGPVFISYADHSAADRPAVVLLDETVVKQRGEEFTLFAAVDPETRHLLHASVAPSRNTLTTWRFLTEIAELYGRVPPVVVTDGASYGPVFTELGILSVRCFGNFHTGIDGPRRAIRRPGINGSDRQYITRIIRRHSVRNRIERWMQELKRRIDTFYASFTGNDVGTTNNWLRQFEWVWNACLS